MAVRSFIFDFFFGPCMNNSAVENRSTYDQHERTSSQAIRLHQKQRQQYNGGTDGSSRSVGSRSKSSRNSSRASNNSSKRLISIPEDDRSKSVHSKRNTLNRSSSTSNSRSNGSTNKHINDSSGSQRNTKARSQRSITSANSTNHTTNSSNGHKPKPRQQKPIRQSSSSKRCSIRRDDASVMSISLFETSAQFINDNDIINEQYTSLVGTNVTTTTASRDVKQSRSSRSKSQKRLALPEEEADTSKQRRPTSDKSQSSNKSELESYLDKTPQDLLERASPPSINEDDDYDNVTTISAASKNPYKVLGISTNATPKEIYSTYKQKLKETAVEEEEEYDGDGEEGRSREYYSNNQAFIDIGNAYRRLKADIQRQEAAVRRRIEEEEQQQQKQGRGSNNSSAKKARSYDTDDDDDDDISVAICRRNNIDARLKDHRELVQDLFATDNNNTNSSSKKKKGKRRNNISSDSSVSCTGEITTLTNTISNQSKALNEMNLVPIEAGACNINEKNETIQNSCFFLSLATSYLSGTGSFGNKDPTEVYYLNSLGSSNKNKTVEIAKLNKKQKHIVMTLALQLKRAIEAAVLFVHSDWAKTGQVVESVQAFSDFLVYALDSDSVLGHWSIVVFDDASGFTDVYRGRHYGKVYPPTRVVKSRDSSSSSSRRRDSKTRYKYEDCDDETKRTNTLTLRYIPGHYQPLLPELTKMSNEKMQGKKGLSKRPMLEDILCSLEKYEVLHVVTDGRA